MPKVRQQMEMLTKKGLKAEEFVELPVVPRVKQVVKYAKEEARRVNQDWVSPEHLVLGLLRERDSVAFQILMNLRIDTEAVRKRILSELNSQPSNERDAEN